MSDQEMTDDVLECLSDVTEVEWQAARQVYGDYLLEVPELAASHAERMRSDSDVLK